MKNKKYIVLIGLFFILNIGFSLYKRAIIEDYNVVLNKIASVVITKYPDIPKEDVIKIINEQDIQYNNVFKEYGIDLKTDAVLQSQEKDFKTMQIGINIFFLMAFLLFILITKSLENKKRKEIQSIIKIIENINKQNYHLDLNDNKEDDMSILKSEIFKTTLTLKEAAENSLQDKKNMKEALENISHQLKTPLTSITIMLNNILDTEEMDEVTKKDFLQEIRKEINHINYLIITLLKLSKFDVNSIEFHKTNTLMSDLIKESIEQVEMIGELKNIVFMVNNVSEVSFYCDINWMKEALSNILKNCLEHSEYNSKIHITTQENKVYKEIKIEDYGIGISKEDSKHLFERFYQSKNSSMQNFGLGLALAKTIVEEHNGVIQVNSRSDGTTFTLKFYNHE